MPKVDKRGKITIPKDIREHLGIFGGMKFEIKEIGSKIVITPYHYKCTECGADIPDGSEYPRCDRCMEKDTRYVY